jgi:hypothetical protein
VKKQLALLVALASLTACSPEKESMSVFLAKEVCSCHFLVGQSEKNCRDAVRIALVMGDVTVDAAKKTVTATAEDKSNPATFRFVDEKFGCELAD